MSYEYILDSSAWMEYFKGSKKGEKLREIVENNAIATSIIAVAELADKFSRDEKSFQNHLLFIQSKAAILPSSIPITLEAATIKQEQRKKKPKFGLADALQFATAQDKEALFVTTDNDFVEMKGVLLVR